MIRNEYTLELCNVFHTGQVEPGTCLQRLMGSVKTGVILKDVSLEVHGGEVLAVLGSKGSGKRALLEVISRRAQGPTRGQILLNGAPMSLRLFQQNCGYVTHKCDLLPGLTVEQTLHYAAHIMTASKVSWYLKRSRTKQVMADLALTQVANRAVGDLTQSEYRRLAIGVQLVRDPVALLLDEPTWDLDPLNTYLVISILSNHARKYGRIVVLTMEKPRSDVFPFLDRVAYLCLGDVVYTGGTRLMLDYFRSIGFPCPELENPLMYYFSTYIRPSLHAPPQISKNYLETPLVFRKHLLSQKVFRDQKSFGIAALACCKQQHGLTSISNSSLAGMKQRNNYMSSSSIMTRAYTRNQERCQYD